MIEYRDIAGFPGYKINIDGDVINKSGHSMHKIKTKNSSTGYYKTKLFIDGKAKYPLIHRLVAIAFIGNPPTDKHVINHKDGNGLNNSIDNLEWVTNRENIIHAVNHGLCHPRKGSTHPYAKLNDIEVDELISEYRNGTKLKELSHRYGIAESTVSRIATGIRRVRNTNTCEYRYNMNHGKEVKIMSITKKIEFFSPKFRILSPSVKKRYKCLRGGR